MSEFIAITSYSPIGLASNPAETIARGAFFPDSQTRFPILSAHIFTLFVLKTGRPTVVPFLDCLISFLADPSVLLFFLCISAERAIDLVATGSSVFCAPGQIFGIVNIFLSVLQWLYICPCRCFHDLLLTIIGAQYDIITNALHNHPIFEFMMIYRSMLNIEGCLI
jgi:hypothetical protein